MDRLDQNDIKFVLDRFQVIAGMPAPLGNNGKVNPHVSRFLTSDGKTVSVFHIKPVYYETLNGSWRPLSEITSYHGNRKIELNKDWRKASPRYVEWLSKRQKILGGELRLPSYFGEILNQDLARPIIPLGLTTTTVYPDPDPETTSVDCALEYRGLSGSAWSSAVTATAATEAVNNSSTTAFIRSGDHQATAGVSPLITRFWTLFDTSALGDTDTINSATFSLATDSKDLNGDNDGTDHFAPYSGATPASNTNLVSGDYDQCGSTAYASTTDYSSIAAAGSYTDWSLNATGLSAISKTGITYICTREGHDATNTAYDGTNDSANMITVRTADYAATTSDPKLVIVHTAAVTFKPKVIMF